MMSEFRVITVPYWIVDILKRKKLDFSSITDFKKMEEYFSLNDLIVLQHLNASDMHDYIGASLNLGSIWARYNFLDAPENGSPVSVEDREKIGVIENLATSDPQYDQQLKDRLMDVEINSDQYPHPYEIHHIGRNLVMLVVYPGYMNTRMSDSLRFTMIRDLLKQSYVYNAFSDICKTSIFSAYMKLLAKV